MHTPDPDRLVPALAGACLVVHRRIGPGATRPRVLDELVAELACRGIRAESVRHSGRLKDFAGLISPPNAMEFDLVVENCVGFDLVAGGDGGIGLPRSGSFEDRLRRHGLAAGLVADFNSADLTDGLWLGRVAQAGAGRAWPATGCN